MKKSILLLAIAVTTIFGSCTIDDDNNNNNNNNNNDSIVDPNNFQGEITEGSVTLDASLTYNLTGSLYVREGATLNIPAGTTIQASGGTASFIAVAQGAKINILGTANDPVVMTSTEQEPGAWGGLVICGRAYTNKSGADGNSATSEVADLTYGGSDDTDNSGSIRYLRVEYTGATFNGSKEFNGVSLFAVGSGTTFEYIQSYNGGDDGIEFFGGAVNGKYLVSTGSGDDSIDFADGWSGTGEYWYINEVTKAGIEGSNNGDNGFANPRTNAKLKNISIVKGDLDGSEGGLYVKEGGGSWNAENIHISGFDLGIKIKTDDEAANTNVDQGNITFNPIQFSTSVTNKSQYEGTNTDYLNEVENDGAGNGAGVPSWTAGWTTGL
jgi:hypothetical protein